MALWKNNRKYPAKIVRFEPDGSYIVEFYDGVKKSVRPPSIRRVLPEDLPFIENCKQDLEVRRQITPGFTASRTLTSVGLTSILTLFLLTILQLSYEWEREYFIHIINMF